MFEPGSFSFLPELSTGNWSLGSRAPSSDVLLSIMALLKPRDKMVGCRMSILEV